MKLVESMLPSLKTGARPKEEASPCVPTTAAEMINTRKMRYTGDAMKAMRDSDIDWSYENYNKSDSKAISRHDSGVFDPNQAASVPKPFSDRVWIHRKNEHRAPVAASSGRNIGRYPLTTHLADWVQTALEAYTPSAEVRALVEPFSSQLHALLETERANSTGLHDLDTIELAYQVTLEIGAAILQAADSTLNPVQRQPEFHSSQAARDAHFAPWGRLLCGLECNPPIIAMFPVYLMYCQSFTFTPNPLREDYVYSALTGVDWAQGKNGFSEKLAAFEKLARTKVRGLEDNGGQADRCFWRISQGYIKAMNECENVKSFETPQKAAIEHDLSEDLVIAFRGIDTIGQAYMANDGAAWLDKPGMDALIGSAVPNDVMDLHTDIKTGETRNLLRLLYPDGLTMPQAMSTMSTILSAQLCELFRGHHRARFGRREDGRIASTSPPYSFCRAQHRRIFAVLEEYERTYPQFWDWTWEILAMGKTQVTQAGLVEPLVDALKRSVRRDALPESELNGFFDIYYRMMEDGDEQLGKKNPLGVSAELAPVIRNIHSLWHERLLAKNKQPGWGDKFDAESDRLFGEAGEILAAKGELADDVYKFAIAYGRLSMALPYIAYHAVDAIILAHGVTEE